MPIQIVARNLELTSAQREIVERRLAFALGRFGDRVSRVTVSVEDLNGPRRGLDQHCRIEVSLVPSGKVMAEATDAEMELAVGRAAERVARCVRSELDRRRTSAIRHRRRGIAADGGPPSPGPVSRGTGSP